MICRAADIPFSWSPRRQEMWNFCRRCYFLHYYAARGGHDANASPELRQLHEMRSLQSEKTYLRQLLSAELRAAFYAPHEEEEPEFPTAFPRLAGAVMSQFRREFLRMRQGEFRRDHASPMLESLYYPDPAGGDAVRERLERRLRRALAALESGVWPVLASVRFLHRRAIESPLAVTAPGGLCCYALPVLAFQEKGVYSFVENSGRDAAALLLRLHALNQLHVPPDRVRTFELVPEEGVLRESGRELNAARTLREIHSGAAEMLEILRLSEGTLRLDDFPPRKAGCPHCRFRGFCDSL